MKIGNIIARLKSLVSSAKILLSHLPTPHRIVLGSVFFIVLVSVMLSENSSAVPVPPGQFRSTLPLELDELPAVTFDEQTETHQGPRSDENPAISYVVQKGDMLSTIFSLLHISQTTLYKLMEADLTCWRWILFSRAIS